MNDGVVTPQGWFRRALSCFGIIVVSWDSINGYVNGSIHGWVLLCVVLSVIAWLTLAFIPTRLMRLAGVCLGFMVLGGGIAASATNGVTLVPAAVAVLWLTRDLRHPLARSIGLGLVGMVVVLVGDVLVPIAPLGVLAMEAALIVAFLSGQSRRQFLVADARSRQLVEEQARADVLAARQQIAHDIHDVLAHSLGGLVIQLDAVDALLEAGDTDAAAKRVRDSRALAAEGLGEARRAVAALQIDPQDSDETVSGDHLVQDLVALLESHRLLGGRVDFVEVGQRREVSVGLESALRRAVQEGLTNARKHAPGKTVSARLSWGEKDVAMTIENPLVAGVVDQTGGGHGLLGMRERFAGLPGGSASAAVESDRFVVLVKGVTA